MTNSFEDLLQPQTNIFRLVTGETVYARHRTEHKVVWLIYPIVRIPSQSGEDESAPWIPESYKTQFAVHRSQIVIRAALGPDTEEWYLRESSFHYDLYAAEAKEDFRRHLKEVVNG